MRYYCTYFDHNYLPRGLALYDSLRIHGGTFELWVLCLSDKCEQALQQLNLPGVKTISMHEFEAGDAPLLAAKQNRSQIEYFFTCTPSLPLFLFKKNPAMDAVTYLDGDLYFFGDAEDVFAEIGEASIAITPHRLPPALRDAERYGIYNVGWITFRRDANALACLEWWRERCLEWCYDREENGRFADQKYLDCWPSKFAGVKVIQHPGVNLAPWNLSGHRLEWERGQVWVDGFPLLVFHFHGLKQLTRRIFDPQWTRYQVKPSQVLKTRIYHPYLTHLISMTDRLNINRTFAEHNPSSSKQTLSEALRLRRQLKQAVPDEAENFPPNFQPAGAVPSTVNFAPALKNYLADTEDWQDFVEEIVVVENHEAQNLAGEICAILIREIEGGNHEAQNLAKEVCAMLIRETEGGNHEAKSLAGEICAMLTHEIQGGSHEAQSLAGEICAILTREIEGGNHEARLFFDWLDALKKYSRAVAVLEKYRSRRWPWFFCPDAWHARAQKKRGRRQVDSLRRQIEPFFSEKEMRQNRQKTKPSLSSNRSG